MSLRGHSQLSLKDCGDQKFPWDWKKANVTAIFKKAKKEDLGNYRLVSLSPWEGIEQIHLETISRH